MWHVAGCSLKETLSEGTFLVRRGEYLRSPCLTLPPLHQLPSSVFTWHMYIQTLLYPDKRSPLVTIQNAQKDFISFVRYWWMYEMQGKWKFKCMRDTGWARKKESKDTFQMSEPAPTPTWWWMFLLVIMARYSRVLPGLEARWSPILYGNRGFLQVGSTSQERAAPLHPSLHVPLWLPSCSVAMGSTF